MYYLYAIGTTENLIEPYNNCYVGVTNNPKRRWKIHQKSQYTVGNYIRKHNLTFDNNLKLIHTGIEKNCFDLEEQFRPNPFIGLNEAKGGHGGRTVYNDERNNKISKKLKGRKKSPEHIANLKANMPNRTGDKNSNAKNWRIISPTGIEYTVCGSLDIFCKEHSLLVMSLRKYVGNPVPEVEFNKIGGFRPKNEIHRNLRKNTTGWMLIKEK